MSTAPDRTTRTSITSLPAAYRTSAGAVHRANGFAVLGLFLFLCTNHYLTTKTLPLDAGAFFAAFTVSCLAYGRVFRVAIERLAGVELGVPFDMLAGFFIGNTLLFALSLATAWGMQVNATVVFGIAVVAGLFVVRSRRSVPTADVGRRSDDATAGALCIWISAIAATLYARQGQEVATVDGLTVFQVWRDAFVHMREISAFSQAFGASSLQDIKLAGSPAQIYHFASYLSPAAVHSFTQASAASIYSSFQLPVGIFLTGIAAFCLASTLWGAWPAVAATVAVVALPDAFQHGFANRYLSYNFLAQINLGMLYGLACVSLAWVFAILGCRRNSVPLVLLSYVFLLLCAFYKAHIFVANALILILYPMLFFTAVRPRWRLATAVGYTAIYLAAVVLTQSHPRVPVLRLDGSGIGYYVNELLSDFDAGRLKSFFSARFGKGQSQAWQALWAAVLLLLCTFGAWLVLAPIAWAGNRKRTPWLNLAFPVVVLVNFMVMSMGLALDSKGIGTLDELLNRPLVWAYFGIVAWAASGLYFMVWQDRAPSGRTARLGCLALVVVALGTVTHFARDLETFPTRGFGDFSKFNGIPTCVVGATDYIKAHGATGDVVQDSLNDPEFAFTALTERQLFAGASTFGGADPRQAVRLQDLSSLMKYTDAARIDAFARERKLSWYLLHPSTPVSWPAAFLAQPAFECAGYRLFRF